MKFMMLIVLNIFGLAGVGYAANYGGPNPSPDEVYKIQVSRNYRDYSKRELRERVWDLERAVWQLQQRVFQLEADTTVAKAEPAPPDTWACTITAMGKPYMGTGPTKAVASAKAMSSCKGAKDQDSFFCKDPKCEQ